MKSLKFTIPVLLLVCLFGVGQTFIKVEASSSERNNTNISAADTNLVKSDRLIQHSPQPVVNKTIEGRELNDNYYDRQWALSAMQLPAYSNYYQGPGRPVQVAILDSGIDRYHEDLLGKVVAEKNFTSTPSVTDINGHGTHLAGIIAANTNNGLGIASIAPFSQLFNMKVADDLGKVYAKDLAEGIAWAVQNGADVINISIEIQEPTPELEKAVNCAWEKGAVVVAAASNHSINPVYPAYFSNCMAVVAINQKGQIDPLLYSKDCEYIAAPGYSIYSTRPNNEYGYMSGTSFATAHVSGLAALLYSIAADTNGNGEINDEVRAAIETAASNITGSGIKLINAASSIAQITKAN